MSKIGKLPIEVPGSVTVNVAADSVSVKGPKGERVLPVRSEIKLSLLMDCFGKKLFKKRKKSM